MLSIKGKCLQRVSGLDPLSNSNENKLKRIDFPDMSDIQKVDFGARSGIIIFKKEIT